MSDHPTPTAENNKRSESWYAILDAAVEEFAEHGRAGVRMEHVAKRAGYNKSLVYRFFKDRDTLFQAALERQFERREDMLTGIPHNFDKMLSWWSDKNRDNPLFMRMILREALDTTDRIPVAAAEREAYYQQQISVLKTFQSSGQLAENMQPEYLFLALLGVSVLPTALPQICRLITGFDPDDGEFEENWTRFLSDFSTQLAK